MPGEQIIIPHKVGLLELARQLGSLTLADNIFGYSRDSFYRFKELCPTPYFLFPIPCALSATPF